MGIAICWRRAVAVRVMYDIHVRVITNCLLPLNVDDILNIDSNK